MAHQRSCKTCALLFIQKINKRAKLINCLTSKDSFLNRNVCQISKLESVLIPVAPWLEKNKESKVVNQGQSVELECSARGVALIVEWKIERKTDKTVKTISGCSSKFISWNILRFHNTPLGNTGQFLFFIGLKTERMSDWPFYSSISF